MIWLGNILLVSNVHYTPQGQIFTFRIQTLIEKTELDLIRIFRDHIFLFRTSPLVHIIPGSSFVGFGARSTYSLHTIFFMRLRVLHERSDHQIRCLK